MRTTIVLASLGLTLSLLSCTEKDTLNPPPPPPLTANQLPEAVAKGPAEVLIGGTVTLDASASSDPDGDALTFLWTEDETNPISNALDGVELTEKKLTFTATDEGTFIYKVRVRDGKPEGEDTAEVTVKVIRNTVKPTLTAIRVSNNPGFTNAIELSVGSAPAVFTTATGVLYVEPVATDEDGEAATLLAKYSANAPGGEVDAALYFDAAKDDDGFGVIPVEVWVEDADGLTSDKQMLEVRVVPQATVALRPKAFFVDCGEVGGEGSMDAPFGTIQAAYDSAVTNGADVYVATGTCTEDTIQVDFDGISLYGMFVREENWRRRTEATDKAIDLLAGAGHKFADRTVIKNANTQVLLQGPQSAPALSSLSLDGFSFEITGANIYAIALTSTAGTSGTKADFRLQIVNSEFTGAVTSNSGSLRPGAIKIKADEYSGTFEILRNFFAVTSATEKSIYYQLWMEPISSTRAAGTQVVFASNVFYGTVNDYEGGSTNSCDFASSFPFAFCLFQANSGHKGVGYVHRNLFYLNAIPGFTNTRRAVVIDGGKGELNSIGNVFVSPESVNKVILIMLGDPDGSGSLNVKSNTFYNAFPTTSPTRTFVRIANKAKDYVCLADGIFYDALNCTGGTDNNIKAIGSLMYQAYSTGSLQPWRISAADFADKNVDTPKPGALWDFDGRYGPSDNNNSSTAEFDIGPFEPGAPLY